MSAHVHRPQPATLIAACGDTRRIAARPPVPSRSLAYGSLTRLAVLVVLTLAATAAGCSGGDGGGDSTSIRRHWAGE
jgi:hypothetical protein